MHLSGVCFLSASQLLLNFVVLRFFIILCLSFLFCIWLLHNNPAPYKLKFRIEYTVGSYLQAQNLLLCSSMLAASPEYLPVCRKWEQKLFKYCWAEAESQHSDSKSFFPPLSLTLISIVVQIYRGLEFICKSDWIYPAVVFCVHNP